MVEEISRNFNRTVEVGQIPAKRLSHKSDAPQKISLGDRGCAGGAQGADSSALF